MNKRTIVFVLILSLVISFFPPFAFDVKANNSISVSINTGDYDSWSDGIRDKTQGILGENGYAVNPDFFQDDVDGDDIWNWLMGPYIDNGFVEDTSSSKPLSRQLYDFSVDNDIDVNSVINDNDTSLVTYVDSYCPYFLYTTIHRSELSDFILPYPNTNGTPISQEITRFSNLALPNSDCIYFVSTNPIGYAFEFGDSNNNNRALRMYEFSYELFENNSVYFLNYFTPTGRYQGILDNSHFFKDLGTINSNTATDMPKFAFFFYGPDTLDSPTISCNCYQYRTNANSFTFESTYNMSSFSYMPLVRFSMATYRPNFMQGGFIIVPDSMENFSIPFFKTSSDVMLFYNGNSPVYQFNPSIDFGDKAGDINFGDLYTFLSNNIDVSLGNLGKQIDTLANDYLEEQIEILHDINNALNDGNGNSWLRKIFKLMESTFPVFKAQNDLLAQKLDSVIDAIENIHFNGGSGSGSSSGNNIDYSPELLTLHNDLLDLKTVTNLIYANMLLDPESDEDPDLDDVLSVMSSRFPFCMVGDVVLVIEIFNAEPVKPDLYFTVPFQPSETWSLDLSFYDGIRPYVFALLTLGFLIFLIRLSMKVYESLKG